MGEIASIQEGERRSASASLVTVVCTCGVLYAIPQVLYDRALEKRGGQSVYCPLGHSWSFSGASDRERLERERQATELARRERNEALASARAQRAAATRARNERDKTASRVKHGVCPCCNRTFKDLGRHIAGQHPDYGPGDPA